MRQLRIEQLSVRFGKLRALTDVSLGIAAGEVVMLAGPNGSGKSTLLRVLLGLVRHDHGRLVVDGREQSVNNDFKARLGYLPEAVAFSENLSGHQVVTFFASARGLRSSRVDEVLERVGLTHAAKRPVRGYSRGMRQRLGLAVSISSVPELLILDEPTGGLDQEGIGVLWSLLREWREAGRMVLVATHDLGLMEHRVDRMCLLQAGTLRADDTPARLRDTARLPARLTITLRAGHDRIQLLIDELARAGTIGQIALSDDALSLDVQPDRLLGVLSACRDAGEVVRHLRVVEPGLERVYEHMLTMDS